CLTPCSARRRSSSTPPPPRRRARAPPPSQRAPRPRRTRRYGFERGRRGAPSLWPALAREEVADLDQGARSRAGVARVVHEPRRGGDVATALPRAQERVRIDGRPVARMDLEVEVRRRLLRVARAPHEADHLAGLHAE